MFIIPFHCPVPDEYPGIYRFPWVSLALSILFCAVFALLFLVALSDALNGGGMFVPMGAVAFFIPLGWAAHVSLAHLLGNILLLFAFGNFANRRMGQWRFLVFVIISGIGGAVAHAAIDQTPVVGASAMVFACLGYALTVAPLGPVRCTFWIVVYWGTKTFPVLFVGLVLLGGQALLALTENAPNVSHVAHGFGLAWGVAIGLLARWRRGRRAKRARALPPAAVAGNGPQV